MCHISVLPRGPSSPSSGCTCTLNRCDVKISFTSNGNSRSVRNHASPMGCAESANHGSRRVVPHTFSRSDGVRRMGLFMITILRLRILHDKPVQTLDPARVVPHTFSRSDGVRRMGLSMITILRLRILHDKPVQTVKPALQFLHRCRV